MLAANTIAARLVRKSRNAFHASVGKPYWNVMPTVASGGTNATAMPTPGSAPMVDLRGRMYPAAAPAVTAIPRSSSPGNVRARTSPGSSRTSVTVPPAISDTSQPTATARTMPHAITAKARHNRGLRAVTMAPATAVIGVIIGATNIAPMTTAAESASRPNAAIDADSMIRKLKRTTYSRNSGPSWGISSSIAACSSSEGSRCQVSRSHWVTDPTAVSCAADSAGGPSVVSSSTVTAAKLHRTDSGTRESEREPGGVTRPDADVADRDRGRVRRHLPDRPVRRFATEAMATASPW